VRFGCAMGLVDRGGRRAVDGTSIPTWFGFDVYARTDKNLTIETSTNLNTWQAVTSFVPSTVPAPVVDHTASNSPMKFCRAVEK